VHSSYQIEYQSVLGIPGRLGKVKAVERRTDYPASLRTVGQENVERYLHIPHAPFTVRAYRTGDSFTLHTNNHYYTFFSQWLLVSSNLPTLI